MDYKQVDFDRRLTPEPPKPGSWRSKYERSPFARDRDRILHSGAFRRLAGKTQVVSPHEADFFRTRLTHTLECGQIGAAIARELGVDEDLTQAICVAHDIGHPPFGHAGERALQSLMRKHGGFEGNAQSLRVITRLETKFDAEPPVGLNLTRRTLGGIIKYPWDFDAADDHGGKFNYYADDRGTYEFARVGMSTETKTTEAAIMDLADEIAYSVHDFEDGIRARFIDVHTIKMGADERPELIKSTHRKVSSLGWSESQVADRVRSFLKEPQFDWATEPYIRLTQQKAAVKAMTSSLIEGFLAALEVSGGDSRTLAVRLSPERCVDRAFLGAVSSEYVMQSREVVSIEHGQNHMLRALFEALKGAGDELLPAPESADFKKLDDHQQSRLVADYIAGMTDRYAERLHARLFGVARASISDIL